MKRGISSIKIQLKKTNSYQAGHNLSSRANVSIDQYFDDPVSGLSHTNKKDFSQIAGLA
jgi:hypothetical protein